MSVQGFQAHPVPENIGIEVFFEDQMNDPYHVVNELHRLQKEMATILAKNASLMEVLRIARSWMMCDFDTPEFNRAMETVNEALKPEIPKVKT